MKPFEIALFKHFIEGKGMTTVYINQYRKNHWEQNPISIEEFLAKVDVSEVCTKAFYFIRNSNYGYDYWSQMQLLWIEFLAANENNYGRDEWWKLQNQSKILRYNWDAAKHWRMESRYTTALRMGIDLKLLGLEDKEHTEPPTKLSEEFLRESTRKEVMERDFTKEKEESKVKKDEPKVDDAPKVETPKNEPTTESNIFGKFEFMDLRPRKNDARRLKDDEISINRRSDKGRITFNQFLSKEFKARGGYEYAALMRNDRGEVVLLMNDTKGVPVVDGTATRSNSNVTIGSKTMVEKLVTFLNIEHEYEIVRLVEIEKTTDYVAYLVQTL